MSDVRAGVMAGNACCEALAPICRDHLRGACRRTSTCKFRHVTLDQYTAEVHDTALRRHHAAAKKRRRRRDHHGDEDDDAVPCCSKSQDRLRVLHAENSSLRKRVADLRRKVALLSSERKRSTWSDVRQST